MCFASTLNMEPTKFNNAESKTECSNEKNYQKYNIKMINCLPLAGYTFI